MKKFSERLDELKAELEPEIEKRIIVLLDTRNSKPLEAVIAWNVGEHVIDVDVPDDATMEDLWNLAEPDLYSYAIALNVNIVEAMSRYQQLKQLGIIYPDGSIATIAKKLAQLYIRKQVTIMEREIKRNQ